MMLHTLALLVAFTSAATVSSSALVCPVNSQSFISTDRTLLPIGNIVSTSESGSNPTANFVNIGNVEPAWCTDGADTVIGQYVELNFTKPVVIALLMSSGFTSVFVNNFTILFTMSSTGEDFQPYGILKSPQDFLVPDIETANANFVLGEQMVARRVRFVISGGMLSPLDQVCWKILLYGCTMAEAQQVETQVDTTTTTTTTTTAPGTSSQDPSASQDPSTSQATLPGSVPVPCTGNQEEAVRNMLLIILPVILGVIVMVIVVVAIVLCICCVKSAKNRTLYKSSGESGRYQTREAVDTGTTTPSSSTMHYDNPRSICYDVPRSMRSRQNSESTLASQAEVKNPIYATKKCVQDFNESPYHLPPDGDNDYEDIPGSPVELANRTATNTSANGGMSPMKSPAPPLPLANGVFLDGPRTPSDSGYAQVNKMRSREKDEMEMESDASPPPVINSHYVSTSNTVLAQEIDRLVTDLENSRAIARQW